MSETPGARRIGTALKQTPSRVQDFGRHVRQNTNRQFARSLLCLGRSRASRSLSRVNGKMLVIGTILDQYAQTAPTTQNALDLRGRVRLEPAHPV